MILNKLLFKRFFSTYKITAEALKKIRQQTSSPIHQCKKALEQSNGDHSAAIQWLKKKGLTNAEKKVDKETREGVIGALVNAQRTRGIMLQINCETDFVAKNELFLKFTNELLNRTISEQRLFDFNKVQNQQQNQTNINKILQQSKPLNILNDHSISNIFEEKKLLISKLQQNIKIRRILTIQSQNGRLGSYVHRNYIPGIGAQACIIEFLNENQYVSENNQHFQFFDNIATQYLGYPPKFLDQNEIPAQVLQKQTEKIKIQMAKTLQKAPVHTHEKIIKGKLRATLLIPHVFKYMNYILSNEGNMTVEDYWRQSEKEFETKIKIGKIENWKCK